MSEQPNPQTIYGLIRDLLTTGDEYSRLRNLELIVNALDQYAPPGVTVAMNDARVVEYLMTGA